MIFRWLRRPFCTHQFHLLTTYKADVDKGVGYDLREIFVIYCPKCCKEKTVLEHEFNKIIERQKVDKEYKDERDRYKWDK